MKRNRRAILARWLVVAGVLAASSVISLTGGASLSAASSAGTPTPNPAPPSRDTTVPLEPAQAVQRGNQTIQVQPIRRTQVGGRDVVADRIIVGFRPGISEAEKAAVHAQVAKAQGTPRPIPLKRVNASAQYIDVSGAPSLDAAIQAYRADPRVAYAEPDVILHTADMPNDPLFGSQYGMTMIHAPAAWSITPGSATVKIAILDCGIYEAHPDLAGKVIARQDFTGNLYGSGTDDRCNHGTHVAGIASADTNNGIGVAGVGYNTALLNGKVLQEQYDSFGNLLGGQGSITWIADGIRWAADNGANVINLSLGAQVACEQTLQDAVDYAWAHTVVIVAAAGNDGANEQFEPADCTHAVAVASTDAADAKSYFSNYGPAVPVAAPGSAILSSINPNILENNGNLYGTKSGTSMATPHVAGLVGLLWATSWGTSAEAVVYRLEATADAIPGTGTNWQYGRINAAAAVAPPPTAAPRAGPSLPSTPPITNPVPRPFAPPDPAVVAPVPTPAPLPPGRR
ncbi:MAG: S8 family serine peptidase [Thermomicrobiales bacterium]